MAPSYLTLAAPAYGQIEVKRSRFHAQVHPATSEPNARAVIAVIRGEHAHAGHHCWAMLLGADPQTARSSDDGEPSGTAGAPILEVLRRQEIGDVVAVVSRWFGGTLLGSGGLARAYSHAAGEALASARLARRVLSQEFTVVIDHADAGRVEHELRAGGVLLLDTEYGESARIRMVAPPEERSNLDQLLAQITGAAPDLRSGALTWRTVEV